MNNKRVIILIAVLALLALGGCALLVGLGVFAGINATQPLATVGSAFMNALKDGDYARAFDMCADDLQTELGSPDELQALVTEGNALPTAWKITSRNITDDRGQLEGTVTFTGERAGTLSIILTRSGKEWKIAGFDFQED